MKRIYTSLGAATLLALSACGSADEDAALENNLTTTEVPADDLSLTADNGLLPADENNALGADLNAVDANLAADANAAANAVNSQ